MKPNFSAARMIAALAKTKLVFYSCVLGLAMSFQVATMSVPAGATSLYAQQNGNIECSVCHTSRGINNRNMYEFTSTGNYFKNNKQLPGNNNNNQGNNNNGGNNNGWNNNNNNGGNNNGWNNNNNNGGNNNGWNNNNNNGGNNNGWNNNNNGGNNNGWNNNNNSANSYSCGNGFRTENNTDYRGNDIQGFRDGFRSCKQRCLNNWRCQGLSWIKTRANKKCWLKYDMNRSSYKSSVVSCVKR